MDNFTPLYNNDRATKEEELKQRIEKFLHDRGSINSSNIERDRRRGKEALLNETKKEYRGTSTNLEKFELDDTKWIVKYENIYYRDMIDVERILKLLVDKKLDEKLLVISFDFQKQVDELRADLERKRKVKRIWQFLFLTSIPVTAVLGMLLIKLLR